jgi:hypothetical protein
MITILKKPYLCSFTKNSIDFELQTDLQFNTATVFPELILSFKAKPVLGTTFNISFTNPENGRTETINLVAVDGSNASNYREIWQIPDTSFSGSLLDLRNIVLEKLRNYPIFNSYYNISIPILELPLSIRRIIITAKEAIAELVMTWESTQPTAEIDKYISEANSVAYHEPVVRDGYALKASLFLETIYGSGNFYFVTAIEAVLDSESVAHVDVSSYLDSEIEASWTEYPLPYEQELGYKAPNLRRYYVEFSEEFANETEAPVLKTEILYAHWGGASTDDAYNLNPVAAQNTSGQWLTWWPSGKRVLKEQNDWLAWMNGATPVTFDVICQIVTNASEYNVVKHSQITLQPFETFVFNTGFEANDLQNDVESGEEIAHWSWRLGFECSTCDIIKLQYKLPEESNETIELPKNEEGKFILVIDDFDYVIEKVNDKWLVTDGAIERFAAVAASGTGNRVMTSENGISWTSRSSSSNSNWVDIASGNGIFVAISSSTNVMISSDGISWQNVTAFNSIWQSICFGNGIFVAVSNSGSPQVMTSPDGLNWTSQTAENNPWNGVAYGNGIFVAVAGAGTNRIMTSPDGITWTPRLAPQNNQWKSICFGNGQFVAISIDGTNRVMTSPDGINWTLRTQSQSNFWFDITYGNGLYVVVGISGTNRIMTSPDGITWTNRTAPTADQWYAIEYGNGIFVSVSQTGTNRVITSTDGITWTSREDAADLLWSSLNFKSKQIFAELNDDSDCPFGEFEVFSFFEEFEIQPLYNCCLPNGNCVEKFRYHPLQNCLAQQILFFNSFGIPETFLLSGEFTQNITTSQELAVRTESFQLNNKLPQNYIFDSRNVISYNAETLMLSNLEAERLMPLINSTITYLVEKNRFVPVVLNAGTTPIFKVNAFLQKIQVEMARANESDRVSYYEVLPDFEPFSLYTVGITYCTFNRNLLNITDFGNIKIYFEGAEIGTFTYNALQKIYTGTAITQEGLLTFILTCEVNGEEKTVKKYLNYKWDQITYELIEPDADIRFSTFLTSTPMRIDWNDGTTDDVTVTDDGETFTKTYTTTGKKIIRIFKPTFSDITEFIVHNAVNQIDVTKFTLLRTVLYEDCVGGNFYFVGLKNLREVAFLNTNVHKLNIGYQKDLENLILAFTNISESNFEDLIVELWTFRKSYDNEFVISITDEVVISSKAQSIIDATGIYAGDGLSTYGITIDFI